MILETATELRCGDCGAVYEISPHTTSAQRKGFADYHAECREQGFQSAARAVIKERKQAARAEQRRLRQHFRLDRAA